MKLVRIKSVTPLEGRSVRLELTNGQRVLRDLTGIMQGPVFEELLMDERLFRQVRVEAGGLAWPGGADLCADAILWAGLPAEGSVPESLQPSAA